ncbi:MAG: hypothetical protein IPO38_15110 [Rhodocyclaceae bacterium]|nr:hypothetical protein [Rhodocyclaceae bacterium]
MDKRIPPKALIDSNPARHGERIGGNLVESYDQDRHKDLLILVASLRFATEITLDAKSCGVAAGITGLSCRYLWRTVYAQTSRHRKCHDAASSRLPNLPILAARPVYQNAMASIDGLDMSYRVARCDQCSAGFRR